LLCVSNTIQRLQTMGSRECPWRPPNVTAVCPAARLGRWRADRDQHVGGEIDPLEAVRVDPDVMYALVW
jgi:hypothetical protein